MTVSSTNHRMDYPGDDTTGPFPFTFKIFDDTDLLVTLRDADGEESTLALNSDYTVDGAGEEEGGEVETTIAVATGEHLTIRRVLPLTQETDLKNQGNYLAETVEDTEDRAVMILQQHQDEIDRSLKLSETTDPADVSVALPTPAAGQLIGWNATEDGFVNVEPGDVEIAIPATDSVDNTILADMAQGRVKGRADSAGTGNPQDLTGAQVRTIIGMEPDATTLEISGTTLRIKAAGVGASHIASAAITGQAAETSPAVDDLILLSDTSEAGALNKMTLANVMTTINVLTADASPDNAADYVVTYDASAGTAKKVLIANLASASPAASTSSSGIIELATAAEVQTGTDAVRAVCPSTQKYHQSACKAWVRFAGASGTIADSYGVTSVAHTGTGIFTITWSTAFNNSNYAVLATTSGTSIGADECGIACVDYVSPPTTTTTRLIIRHGGGTLFDPTFVFAMAFGDLP